jgi:hypothetical protein
MAIDPFIPTGDDVTTFARQGISVVTTVTRGNDAHAAVVGLRKAHYQPVLDGFGVEVWDGYDADAIHFICFADGDPVACMRSSWDRVTSGEAATIFPELASALPGRETEYLYLSRQLVVPEFRGIGLSAMITHVAATWWMSKSPLRYAVAASKDPTGGSARALGGMPLADLVYLGPENMPLRLMGAPISALAERTATVLGRHSWMRAVS